MPAELHYAADIGSLCRRREIADGHVLEHTATERAHLGHLGTSCPKGCAVDTLILADRRRPSRPLSFCRDSGFVQSLFADFHEPFFNSIDPGCSLIPGLGSSSRLIILAGSRVLSAVGACPPHDGVR